MKKDYKKVMKDLYLPKPGVPGIVDVPRMSFLMVSGKGHPDEAEFAAAASTVFPLAYVAKFVLKEKHPDDDFVVMPMEVKWRLDRSRHGSERYSWTLMVMQPGTVTKEIIGEALERLKKKKKDLPFAGRLRLVTYRAGLSGRILHAGPYGEPMERTFALLKDHLGADGFQSEPDSHDVYFNDVRRCAPEKLKTLIRVRIWRKDGVQPELEEPFLASKG